MRYIVHIDLDVEEYGNRTVNGKMVSIILPWNNSTTISSTTIIFF